MDPWSLIPLVRWIGFGGSGALALLLAIALLATSFQSRLNRALALFLGLYGFAGIANELRGDEPEIVALRVLARVGAFWATLALLYFAALYRDQYARSRLSRIALPVLVVAGALFGWLHTTRQLDMGLAGALAQVLRVLGLSAAATVLAFDAARATGAAVRRAQLLASLGFGFLPIAFGLHLLIPGLMGPSHSLWEDVAYGVGLLPLGVALVRLARMPLAPDARADVRRYLRAFGLPVASVLLLALLRFTVPLGWAVVVMLAMMAAWAMSLHLLVGYAVLRHQIFGIDARLKWTISRGTIAGVFLLVFVVSAQLAQNYFEDALGWATGGLVAGMLLFALAPLQRAAERVAEAALPGVRAPWKLEGDERLAFYREQARAAWEDGALSREERRMLDVAREKLGLPDDVAARLEREAMASEGA